MSETEDIFAENLFAGFNFQLDLEQIGYLTLSEYAANYSTNNALYEMLFDHLEKDHNYDRQELKIKFNKLYKQNLTEIAAELAAKYGTTDPIPGKPKL